MLRSRRNLVGRNGVPTYRHRLVSTPYLQEVPFRPSPDSGRDKHFIQHGQFNPLRLNASTIPSGIKESTPTAASVIANAKTPPGTNNMLNHLSLKARLWLLGLVSALGVAVLALSSIWHAYPQQGNPARFCRRPDRRQPVGHFILRARLANGAGVAQHPARSGQPEGL